MYVCMYVFERKLIMMAPSGNMAHIETVNEHHGNSSCSLCQKSI